MESSSGSVLTAWGTRTQTSLRIGPVSARTLKRFMDATGVVSENVNWRRWSARTVQSPRLDPKGAVWTLAVTYVPTRPLSLAKQVTTYVTVDAVGATEAKLLAAQIVGTQQGEWMGRPHPEMVIDVEIIGCEV